MSVLLNQARNRVPRLAEAAVEHARLTVVPRRRQRAPRVPFVMLVSLLLVGGVAGLLTFNTSMQQASFTATALQARATVLNAKQQALQMQLEQLRDPQRLALRARQMGLVPPTSPVFIRLSDGKIVGTPTPALAADALRITSLPTRKPKNLRLKPIRVKAPKVKTDKPGGIGAATTDQAASNGKKGRAHHRHPTNTGRTSR
jgi:type II secretory pathway pseudopilin PulG